MSAEPPITVLVVNYGRRELLDECLASVRVAAGNVPGAVELIVIDNGSADGSAEMVRERHQEATLVALDENEGFAPAVVRGTDMARGRWLVLVNNDATIEPDTLALMIAAGESSPDIGAVTAQVRFTKRPDVINTAGLEVDKLGIAYDRLAGRTASEAGGDAAVEVFGASGCVVAYRAEMLAAIGGFDASFFAFLEDADVAWRARMAGWRSLYEPRAVAHHHGSATAGEGSAFKYFLVGRNRIRLLAKNATAGQLLRWGLAMGLYDLAYVAFVAASDRTFAPLRGRLRGLTEWRAYRRAGAEGRRPVTLASATGWLHALRMRASYRRGS